MVERVEAARAEVEKLEAEATGQQQHLAMLRQRRDELTSVTSDFRSRGYDRNSSFEWSDFLGSVLGGFLGGMLSRGDFWGQIERQRRQTLGSSWGGGWSGGGSWGGGSSRGGSWGGSRSPGSGRIGGGGFRTGGRIGGGGFRTGRKI